METFKYNDKMQFLDNSDQKSVEFITANDQTGFLHLYHVKLSLEPNDCERVSNGVLRSKLIEKSQLTEGDWCVEIEHNVVVDQKNHLVYFTGFRDPVENHL